MYGFSEMCKTLNFSLLVFIEFTKNQHTFYINGGVKVWDHTHTHTHILESC